MPNYLEYQKSIAHEFKAYENRVRYMIDDVHWGEEGRYKEIILMNYLKRILPKNISVGSGFVRNRGEITTQIDLIIYDNTYPSLFSEGDFVILTAENVLGIIEVKTNINDLCESEIRDEMDEKRKRSIAIYNAHTLEGIIKKAVYNNQVIGKKIFNGIFSFNFNNDNGNQHRISSIKPITERIINNCQLSFLVNHMALSENCFVKLWDTGNQYLTEKRDIPCFCGYDMSKDISKGLAYSYLFSNLLQMVSPAFVNIHTYQEMERFLYPIEGGKENVRAWEAFREVCENV